MTEEEWLTCEEPQTLLEFLQGKISERKSRLLAAALCRHILHHSAPSICHRAIEIAEQYADGLVSVQAMIAVSEQVSDVYCAFPSPTGVQTEPTQLYKAESISIQSTDFATRAFVEFDWLLSCCQCTDLASLRWSIIRAELFPGQRVPDWNIRLRWQISLIRDIFGNPFRPFVADPVWLTPTAVSIATAIYQDRAFDRLPILADALEEAGCTNADVLLHCRQSGEHVRGCWVVDLVLGKE